jgi:DNA-binding LacI/PurR family transcriptional regulator
LLIKNKEIAKKAGVSTATVSLVINNKPGVGDETRARVLEIISQMSPCIDNKLPIPSTKTGSFRFIKYKKHGLVADDNGFIDAIIDGVESESRSSGYDVIISMVTNENKEQVINEIINDPKDGLVILGTELESIDLALFKSLKCPMVVVDNILENDDFDCIVMNNKECMYKAVNFLYDLGFREIGHLQSSVEISNFTERREGYINSLAKLGLHFNPDFTFLMESTFSGAYRDMKSVLNQKVVLPKALVADNDTIAIGAIKALKESNIKIPEDISIIGIDDIPFSTMIEPSLTTIRIYKEHIGSIAVKKLVEKINNKDLPITKTLIGSKLVERSSVFVTGATYQKT